MTTYGPWAVLKTHGVRCDTCGQPAKWFRSFIRPRYAVYSFQMACSLHANVPRHRDAGGRGDAEKILVDPSQTR